ncbi:amidohydrolase [Planosporangium sp. 12N6]|uniref:amidohydrolase n=1 Tax=Planosporangium spinosum TaxID=3402278 RepID=UPI003CEF7B1A
MQQDAQAADEVIFADQVLTMGGREISGPAAVAIRDGRILDVVPRERAGDHIGSRTRVLDAGRRTIMPGFVDVHAHSEVAARTRYLTVDCRAPECATISDVLDTLTDALPQARDGWLVGEANLFYDQKLAEKRFPTRAELDSVSRTVAIALRCGGHLTVLNSRALELAGIDADYQAVTHSITGMPTVERDAGGVPTGIVKEMDNLLPLPGLGADELRTAIAEGITELFTRHGVTTIGEISETVDGMRHYDANLAAGTLAARMHFYLWVPGTVSLDQACDHRSWLRFDSPEDLIRVQGVKMFSDGGYSAASAAMKRPYALDPHGHHCGAVALSAEQLAEALRRTAEAGLQLAVHANGDRAQEEVCAAFEGIQLPAGALRPRVEHAGNFVPDYEWATEAWRRAGIIPVPQPVFLYNFGEFIPTYVGEYARRGQFPFRRLLDDGWPISGSSDVWIGSEQRQTNPFFSIACCVSRHSFHGDPIEPDQTISRIEALRMHTLNAAAAMGQDGNRGSLEPGKFADLIIVDRDPLTCAEDEIAGIEVDQVFLGGRSVHVRAGAQDVTA